LRLNEIGLVKEAPDLELDRPLELIPTKPNRIRPFDRDCFIIETAYGKLALWIHHRSEAVLAYQIQILKICETCGTQGFLYPIPLTDGRTYAPLDERRWFYLTNWPELRKVSFRSATDLCFLVKLIAGFRKAMAGQGLGVSLPERNEDTELFSRFCQITQSLDSFALLAQNRLRPTQFDRLFLAHLPEAKNWLEQSLALLKKCGYNRLWATVTTQDIIINRLVRSNLMIHPTGAAFCLRLNDFRWDLPIIDLAILLIKTGRSGQWNPDWLNIILSEYREFFPITASEEGVLRAYLTFPWSFYRLAARYYYNRTQWPVFTFIEKMERVLADEKQRGQLIRSDLFRNNHF
jgi:CotS family spore coat protein